MKKNNFLNNQNYILWKTEKKKLLSKFFIQKSIKKIYEILTLFYYYSVVIFFILFWFFWVSELIKKNGFSNSIILLFFMIIFFFWSQYLFKFWKKDFFIQRKEINSFYNFLFIRDIFYFLQYPILIFSVFIPYFKKIKIKKNHIKKESKVDILKLFYTFLYPFILFIVSVIFWLFWLDNWIYIFLLLLVFFYFINIFSFIILPFFIITVFFITIYWLIYSFVFKWINWYRFLKAKPNVKKIWIFIELKTNFWKNKFYKISLK